MEPASISEKVGVWFSQFDRLVSGEILTPAPLVQAPAIMLTLLAASIVAGLAEPWLRRLLTGVAVDHLQGQVPAPTIPEFLLGRGVDVDQAINWQAEEAFAARQLAEAIDTPSTTTWAEKSLPISSAPTSCLTSAATPLS